MNRTLVVLLALPALASCSLLPSGAREQRPAPQSRGPQPTQASPRCLGDLGTTGARFSPVEDRYYGAGCSTLGAVQLSALRGDTETFALSNIGPVSCPLAESLAGWARYGVDRAARQILGAGLARIETFGSYSCRNVAGSGRRSAHATAEAVDISGFLLADGRRVTVKQGWTGPDPHEREFLRIVFRSACKRFGTVLGPDYNVAHADHLHLEAGGGSFCR